MDDLIADLNTILEDDWRAAERARRKGLALAAGSGLAVALLINYRPDITFLTLMLGLLAGFFTAMVLLLLMNGAPGDYQLGDEVLGKLANADISCSEAFETLKGQLERQGYVSLEQANKFVAAEHRERQRLVALASPGAMSLRSREAGEFASQ